MNDVAASNRLPAVLAGYVEAWNRHDGPGIVATFASGGTYSDPMTGGPLSGDAIARYAEGLWQAFPDLRFELDGTVLCNGETAFMPWKMLGTNSAAFRGLPPSGRSVSVNGVDVVRLSAEGLHSVVGYFDSRAVPDQLGLQVIVQPHSIGPFSFGISTRVVSGSTATPQGFSVTSLEPRTPAEREEIRNLGRETMKEMLRMEGFIAASSVNCGNRQMTFSAWETAEHAHQLRNSAAHGEAMRRFFGKELAAGGMISHWQPATAPRTFGRCPRCEKMVNIDRSNGLCGCGATVSAPSYW
jgi:steroid delta-isomerase-like uncharacterized protein